ncbi:MAG: S9 family peptidase [Pirellulales bacterium]|nr:S9 family peptidase [Pirellulales bacterium]
MGLALLLASSLNASTRPLGIDDIESWKRITEKVISPNGAWIAYKTEPSRGDSKIYLHSSEGEKQFESDCGRDIRITDDSAFMLFTVEPPHAHVRELKQKRTKKSDMPGNVLGIRAMGSGKLETIENIRNYKIPRDWAGWLAYQVETSSKTAKQENSATKRGRRESREKRLALNLRHLETGATRSWPCVTEYHFTAKAKKLFFVSTGNHKGFEAGLYLHDLDTGHTRTVITGRNEYRQISASPDGDMLAFLLRSVDGGGSRDFSLCVWTGQGEPEVVVDARDERMPEKWRISENGSVSFSANGERIFFGTAPARPARDPSILDDEFPGVDVWHGSEGLLHTVQLVNRDRELRRAYRAMYDRNSGRLVQIETEDAPQSRLIDHGNADQVVLYSSKPYELQSMWDPMRYDVYLLDSTTGARRVVAKGLRARPAVSPGGKYLIWFDYSDYSYYTHHIGSAKTYRISEPSVLRADEESNTTFDYRAPYGVSGWLDSDRAVLIYDRYDIWKVDPENRTRPENVTKNGRKQRTVYRLIRFGRSENALDENKTHYLTGTNEVSRASGYYRWTLKHAAEPERLIAGAYRLSEPLKADDAETVVYTKETFGVFPDLLVSDLTFRQSVRLSDANPQQAAFRWGTAELHRWTSLDGRPLEGILYKPEGFDPTRRYPMIVQFFHKSSDQLFVHRTPEFHRSRIDYHYFVSNGYLVFNPDIHFDPGYVGESAYKSIMPGVTSLVDKGFVDPERIGAQGHSYSGYQAAYLATRTNAFACIEAGAPVVNFFSAYGGIRWETGRNRAAQYEHDQTLATIWEAPLRFLENSPLFAMDKVTTPILIMHNDRDGSVPWYQGIEYFNALRRLQRPVWLLNYNGEGHTLRQLKNRKDFQIRLAQFFNHYLKGAPMPEWMREGVPAVEKDHNLGYELKR